MFLLVKEKSREEPYYLNLSKIHGIGNKNDHPKIMFSDDVCDYIEIENYTFNNFIAKLKRLKLIWK
jgi:hypothetical protein